MQMNHNFKSKTVLILQLLVGLVFIYSGFVKLIDPFGGYYKIIDYLTAFSWGWLKMLGFLASILMSATEFAIGVCLVLGVRIKWTTIALGAFMAFYTPLTLYIAIYNPVTDCGCFGDALIITNWQTFYKNIVIDLMALTIWFWRGEGRQGYCWKSELLIAGYTLLFCIGTSIYCMENLPIVDFRPYRIGINIPKSMEIPEGAPRDSIVTTLIYEKNGVKKDFTIDNYPKDSTWTFVDSKNEVVRQGYIPPIHDFTMEDPEIGEITDDVINDPSYVFLLVAHNLTEYNLLTNPSGAHYDQGDKVNAVYQFAQKNHYKFYCMTSTGTGTDEMNAYQKATGAAYPFVNSDEIMLKTIIRSSPGLLLIKNGDVLNKWSLKNIPAFNEPLEKSELGKMQTTHSNKNTVIFFLLFALPLVIGFSIGRKKCCCKK